MWNAIQHNLGRLISFQGRDARQTFWFYVLFLIIVQYAVGMVIAWPMMGAAMQEGVSGAMAGADPVATQARIMGRTSAFMATSMWFSAAMSLVMALLLLASFVRRLHDSGKPGWIALVVLVIHVGGTVLGVINAQRLFAAMARDPLAITSQAGSLAIGGLAAWLAPILVIVFGVLPSTHGANRYGEEPENL